MLAELLSPEDEILDVGCGPGSAGRELQRFGFSRLTGLDLSEGMLQMAARSNLYRSLHRGCLGEPLPFADRAFRCALGVGVFTQGHAGPESLQELARVVDGYVVFSLRPDLAEQLGFSAEFERLQNQGLWRLHHLSEELTGFNALQTAPYRFWVFKT